MKKVTTAIIGFFIFVSMSLVTLDIYTKKQIDDFILGITHYRGGWGLPYDVSRDYYYIDFISLLEVQMGTLGYHHDEYNIRAHDTNIRERISDNPSLVHTAINMYGDYFVKQISSQLEYQAQKKGLSFSSVNFWNCQKNNIKRYQLLIKELLALNDKELDYFISIASWGTELDEARSYGLNKWLLEKKLLESDTPSINPFVYPGDFILCTQRFTEDFTLVSNRVFLTHAEQACKELIEKIDKYKYD